MSPDGIRSVSHVLIVMGLAAFIGLVLEEHVWRLAGWALVLLWVLAGIALDVVAARAEHRVSRR